MSTALAVAPSSAAPRNGFDEKPPTYSMPDIAKLTSTTGQAINAVSIVDTPLEPKPAKKNTKTLFILTYSSVPSTTVTPETVAPLLTSVDRFMRTASDGRRGETFDITPQLRVNAGCSNENYIHKKARNAAKKAGYKLAKYKRIAVYFPRCEGFAWAGLADVGPYKGKKQYHVWIDGYPATNIIAHEFLHNYGERHSASVTCKAGKQRVAWKANERSCRSVTYGDAFDAMGNRGTYLSASQKKAVGWLKKGQVASAHKGKKTITVVANESALKGKKLIRIGTGGDTLDIEYRGPVGMDADVYGVNYWGEITGGVQIRNVVAANTRSGNAYSRQLLDLQPNNSADLNGLVPGQSWTTPSGVRISVLSAVTDSARIKVDFRAGKVKKPGTPTIGSVAPGDSSAVVNLAAPVSSRGKPVLKYQVEAVGATGRTVNTSDARGGAVLVASATGLTNGVGYTVRVRAGSEKGWGAWSAGATVAPVPTPPLINAINVAEGQTFAGGFAYTGPNGVRVNATPNPLSGSPISSVRIQFTNPATADDTWCTITPGGTDGSVYGADGTGYCADYGFELYPGTWVLTVTATDAARRVSTASRTITVTP
jgi:hypothetical protein